MTSLLEANIKSKTLNVLLHWVLPIFSLLITLSNSITANAQDLDDIFDLHRQNLESIYQVRGAPKEWIETGKIATGDIVDLLDQYNYSSNINVGVLMYTHYQDTLSIILFRPSKMGNDVLEFKEQITKDKLQLLVHRANLYLSNPYLANGLNKRGVNLETEHDDILQGAFTEANRLLIPFKDFLLSLDHLIIVPTHNISISPFYAFRLSDSTLMIDKLSLSIAPSVFELMVSDQINKIKLNNYADKRGAFIKYQFSNALIVANPDYPKDNSWNFPALPGTVSEIESILPFLDSNSFTLLKGEQANPSAIMDEFAEYDLLYFATHGISSSSNAMDSSFLVFAPDSTGSYLISARQILHSRYNRKLNADLVIMSACQTGLGMGHEGGVVGLARSFQIAGANHVLMSLWNISDQETATLMVFFFENLTNGERLMPHQALRNAILRYRIDVNDDPSVWAAFTIMGVPY